VAELNLEDEPSVEQAVYNWKDSGAVLLIA
jgi:hypothetical protein